MGKNSLLERARKELRMDEPIELQDCPRCGWAAYEYLRFHSHCTNCNYSPGQQYSCEELRSWNQWNDDLKSEIDQIYQSTLTKNLQSKEMNQ